MRLLLSPVSRFYESQTEATDSNGKTQMPPVGKVSKLSAPGATVIDRSIELTNFDDDYTGGLPHLYLVYSLGKQSTTAPQSKATSHPGARANHHMARISFMSSHVDMTCMKDPSLNPGIAPLR
jgi:hypothetical protein